MLIYIEGAECSGKTTLATKLYTHYKKLGYKVEISDALSKMTRPCSPSRSTADNVLQAMLGMSISTTIYICNRGPLSDIIYRAFDDYPVVVTYETLVSAPVNYVLIICDNPHSEEYMRARGEFDTHHKQIKYWFNQLGRALDNTKFYNWENTDIDVFIEDLEKENMLIYIEGVDGSGKTTLVNKLYAHYKHLGYDVEINDKLKKMTLPDSPIRSNETELIQVMLDMVESKTIHICDRGPLSDIVYRAFDEYPVVLDYKKLMSVTKDLSWKYVLIICDNPHSEDYMMSRGDSNPVAILYHKQIKYWFKQLGNGLDHVKFYDWTNIDTNTYIFIEELYVRD